MDLSCLLRLLKAASDHQKRELASVLTWLVAAATLCMVYSVVESVKGCGDSHVSWHCSSLIIQFVRCSVDGLSLPMFIMAVLGNLTYALGVLLYSVEPHFLLPSLPWLVGSVGTLMFDATVSPLTLRPGSRQPLVAPSL